MKELKNKIVVIVLSMVVLFLLYNKIIISPNSYLFSASGDGIKNYYTSDFFVNHEDLSFHTQSQNYPYGEFIVYTDNQPSISWLLILLKNIIPSIVNYTVGIYNFLMLFSICIAALFYYIIARKLSLPPLYSGAVSLIVAFLSPQVERFTGHYALGYVCFVPMLWYLLIKTFEKGYSVKYSIYIFIYNLFFGFIHPYYILIGALFVLVYTFCHLLYSKFSWSKFISYSIIAISPAIVQQLILKIIDATTDRPTNPWGLYDFATRFEGLFIPVFSPFLDIWNSVIKVRSTDIESRSYVGMLGAVIFILSLIKIVKYIKRKRYKLIFKSVLPTELRTALLCSILILLFAMAMPFRLGLGFLLDIIPAIKQFRSLGRFAWVFYSVFTMYSAYYLFLLYRKYNIQKKAQLAILLVCGLLSIWAIEAYINNWNTIKKIENKVAINYYDDKLLSKFDSLNIDINRFQSILPLPIYLIGSEVIGIHNDASRIVFQSMKLSSLTGLGINSTMLSRTSLTQSMKMASFVSDSLINREAYIKDLKPIEILIITKNKDLSSGEKYVLSQSTLLFTDEQGFGYYSLFPQKLTRREYTKDGTEIIIEKKGRNTIGKHDWYYWNTYDNTQTNAINKSNSVLFEGELLGYGEYECSFWLKLSNKKIVPKLTLETFNENKELMEKKNFDCGVFSNVSNGWLRVSNVFKYDEKCRGIRYSINSESDTIDNLLIKSINLKLLGIEAGKEVMIDNFEL